MKEHKAMMQNQGNNQTTIGSTQ